MNVPSELSYSKSHEWVKNLDSGGVQIGITDFAQEALGDIVFVSLPEVSDAVTVDDSFADIESVKAVSDVFSPVSGTVSAVNSEVSDDPSLINSDPYSAWLIEVSDIEATDDLMDADAYVEFCANEAH